MMTPAKERRVPKLLRSQKTSRRRRGPQLTERDMEILRWIARHGVVTTELVGLRFFWRPRSKQVGKWAAYRRLKALDKLGLILRDKPFAHRPEAIRVSTTGARLADVGVQPAPLVVSQLDHAYAVIALSEYLLADNDGAALTTERELRAQRFRDQRAGEQKSGGRTPDALLEFPKAKGKSKIQTIAVELDLSRKDRRQMQDMIRAYDREKVDQVWWYVKPERVERTREVVRDLRADDRIEVREWRG
ncbi:MAG: hypothetical protein ACRDMH_07030 [Solirubrobacterales bacterium]